MSNQQQAQLILLLSLNNPASIGAEPGSLLEDHVVVGVVEGVSAHHPHEPRVQQGLVGRPTQRLGGGFDAGQLPEGLSGGNGERAVRT